MNPNYKPQISDQQLRGLVRDKEREREKKLYRTFLYFFYLFHQRSKKKNLWWCFWRLRGYVFNWVGSKKKKHFQTHSEPKVSQTFPLQSFLSNMCLCNKPCPLIDRRRIGPCKCRNYWTQTWDWWETPETVIVIIKNYETEDMFGP